MEIKSPTEVKLLKEHALEKKRKQSSKRVRMGYPCKCCGKKNQEYYKSHLRRVCIKCVSAKKKPLTDEQKASIRAYQEKHKPSLQVYRAERYKKMRGIYIPMVNRNNVARYNNDKDFRAMTNVRQTIWAQLNYIRMGAQSKGRELPRIGCNREVLEGWLNTSGKAIDSSFDLKTYDKSKYQVCRKKSYKDFKRGLHSFDEVIHYTNLEIRKIN